ncbi:MAG TPA: hypothetical protein VMR02_03055 [Terracidiphilus sp.]|jgi:hypothetical protein|nr:hypothetical protein [Terracidiphilus sp.]
MFRENPLRVALLVVAAELGNSALGSVALAESFDNPLRETVVDSGKSSYLMPGSRSRIQHFCS